MGAFSIVSAIQRENIIVLPAAAIAGKLVLVTRRPNLTITCRPEEANLANEIWKCKTVVPATGQACGLAKVRKGVGWDCPPTCPNAGATEEEKADYLASSGKPPKPIMRSPPRVIDRYPPLYGTATK